MLQVVAAVTQTGVGCEDVNFSSISSFALSPSFWVSVVIHWYPLSPFPHAADYSSNLCFLSLWYIEIHLWGFKHIQCFIVKSSFTHRLTLVSWLSLSVWSDRAFPLQRPWFISESNYNNLSNLSVAKVIEKLLWINLFAAFSCHCRPQAVIRYFVLVFDAELAHKWLIRHLLDKTLTIKPHFLPTQYLTLYYIYNTLPSRKAKHLLKIYVYMH